MPSDLNKQCKCKHDSAHLQQGDRLYALGLPTFHGGWGGHRRPHLFLRDITNDLLPGDSRIIFRGSKATHQLSRIR